MPIVTCPACATPLEIPEELVGRAVRCGNCSKPFEAMPNAPAGDSFPVSGIAETPLAPQSPVSTRPFEEPEDYADFRGVRRDLVPHRGVLIMVLGIVAIALTPVMCFACPFLLLLTLGLGITAWVMGSGDLKQMNAGSMDPDGRGQTKAGLICGIVAVGLSILAMVGMIAYFVILFGFMAAANPGKF